VLEVKRLRYEIKPTAGIDLPLPKQDRYFIKPTFCQPEPALKADCGLLI
jgi:hypothetical protein